MLLDLTKLSEDDLIELNRCIVERLQLIRSAKRLAQLARFSESSCPRDVVTEVAQSRTTGPGMFSLAKIRMAN